MILEATNLWYICISYSYIVVWYIVYLAFINSTRILLSKIILMESILSYLLVVFFTNFNFIFIGFIAIFLLYSTLF